MPYSWYNKNAPKNTIVRYLSQKYTLEELTNLTHLELPDQFESLDYSNELTEILKDSPWKVSEVKYKTSSLNSLKGIFTQDYWFGKKKIDDNVSVKSESSQEVETEPQDTKVLSDDLWDIKAEGWNLEIQEQWEDNFTKQEVENFLQRGLKPEDYKFAEWLEYDRRVVSHFPRNIRSVITPENLAELRKEYENDGNPQDVRVEMSESYWLNLYETWGKKGDSDWNTFQKRWQTKGFAYEEVEFYKRNDFGCDEEDFAAWLRDVKKLNANCSDDEWERVASLSNSPKLFKYSPDEHRFFTDLRNEYSWKLEEEAREKREQQKNNLTTPILPGSFPDQPSSEISSIVSQDQPLITYEFQINEFSLITLWRKLGEIDWQTKPYQDCLFDTKKTYRVRLVTAQTTQPLPEQLPQGVNCLFEEVLETKEELLKKNDWSYCLITKTEPIIDSESETSDNELSETESELQLKGTYRYEFATDKQGLISAWRTPSSWWKTKENNIYSNYYLAPDISKYANSYCKIKTLEPLPLTLNLSTQKCLFSPILNEKDFYNQEKNNWTNCYIWEQEPLEYCAKCSEPLFTNQAVKYCANSCQIDKAANPTTNWFNSTNLLILTGVIVLVVIIYQNQE